MDGPSETESQRQDAHHAYVERKVWQRPSAKFALSSLVRDRIDPLLALPHGEFGEAFGSTRSFPGSGGRSLQIPKAGESLHQLAAERGPRVLKLRRATEQLIAHCECLPIIWTEFPWRAHFKRNCRCLNVPMGPPRPRTLKRRTLP